MSLLITVLAPFYSVCVSWLHLQVWNGQLVRVTDLFWIVEAPQSVRQEIRETRKPFPLRRGRGEAMIEPGIHYEIVPDRIRDGPQIPDCISVDEWLREMPEFACDCQPSQ